MSKRSVFPWHSLCTAALVIFIGGCTSGPHVGPTPNTTNKTAQRIHRNLPTYANLARQSWSAIYPQRALPLKLGMRDPSIPMLRERLIKLGDLADSTAAKSQRFDHALTKAVKQFQWRHGLKPDGAIGSKTLRALNVPPTARFQQLQASMKRWAKFPEKIGSRYIRVNVASFNLDLIEDGHKIITMKVVAGKPTRPTPELYSKVKTIVVNPKWNIPRKIARKDIIPKILQDPNYLADNNISIYTSWKKDAYKVDPNDIDWQKTHAEGFPYRFTQAPGDNNALGRVKFVFLNKQDIYMHDTPQKGLFAKIQRAFSSGCIRLEKPYHLVEYFIQNSPDLTHEKVITKLESGETKYIKIRNPIPIYITYITAWVDKDGYTHFREDVYKRVKKRQRLAAGTKHHAQ